MLGILRRRRRAVAAGSLLALAGLIGLGPAHADPTTAPAVISRQAYFTNPITQVTPPVLRNGFPPATACLVAGLVGAPQVCGSQVQQLSSLLGLSDGIPVLVTPDGDLAQPVAPNTTPVGMLGGQQRYASLFQLALPALPVGEQFGSFDLVLHQDGLNFSLESPALRDVVEQIVAQLEKQDPQKIADAIQRAITGQMPLVDQHVTGIEACPATQEWPGGAAQGAALDGTRLPNVDCLSGTTGVFDPKAGTWTFDLTYAAQSWTTGLQGAKPIDNQGILLRPAGAPNLAYGDPDLSTNWVVSLADAGDAPTLRPTIRYTTVPAAGASGGGGGGGAVALPGGAFEIPALGGSDGGLSLGSPTITNGGASTIGALRARYERGKPTGGHPQTEGWVWLALPFLVGGALLLGDALRAKPARAKRRSGALTRLEARLDLAREADPRRSP